MANSKCGRPKKAKRVPPKVTEHVSSISEIKDSTSGVDLVHVNTDLEGSILVGDFHQADSRFSSESRGIQCTAIACTALCYSSHKPILTWKTSDLNSILDIGDRLYTISKQNITDKNQSYLTFDEVYQFVRIGSDVFQFGTNEENENGEILGIVQGLECSIPLLIDSLSQLFTRHNLIVLTCKSSSVAIFHSDSAFHLFDSHSRDKNGFPVNDGTSIFCTFKSLNGLAHQIHRSFYLNPMNCSYTYSMTSVNVERFISYGNEAQYLKIKRMFESDVEKSERLGDARMRKEFESSSKTSEKKRFQKEKMSSRRQTLSEWHRNAKMKAKMNASVV